MSKIGLYAGSFDPVTNGHLELIQRAATIVDQLYVVIMKNTQKQYTFSFTEKRDLLAASLKDAQAAHNIHLMVSQDQLVTQVAQQVHANFLIRGLRTPADLEYELNMQEVNRLQVGQLETIYLIAHPRYAHISSSMVKEIVYYHGNIDGLVPPVVAQALAAKRDRSL